MSDSTPSRPTHPALRSYRVEPMRQDRPERPTFGVFTHDGAFVAECPSNVKAEHVALALCSHAALVAACEAALRCIDPVTSGRGIAGAVHPAKAVEALRSALALSRGTESTLGKAVERDGGAS